MSASRDPVATKVDFRRSLDSFTARLGEFRLLELPPMSYLMIDGQDDPNTSPEFETAVGALYPAAYALKFASRRLLGRDYVVPPLEALWFAQDMRVFTTALDKSQWSWTLMILAPDWVCQEMLADAVGDLQARRSPAPPRLGEVRLARLDEGLCVQTLHVGSFDGEAPVLARMHDVVIPERGLVMTGVHHEIYLSDFRRVPPDRLRTILRQPVRQSAAGV